MKLLFEPRLKVLAVALVNILEGRRPCDDDQMQYVMTSLRMKGWMTALPAHGCAKVPGHRFAACLTQEGRRLALLLQRLMKDAEEDRG